MSEPPEAAGTNVPAIFSESMLLSHNTYLPVVVLQAIQRLAFFVQSQSLLDQGDDVRVGGFFDWIAKINAINGELSKISSKVAVKTLLESRTYLL